MIKHRAKSVLLIISLILILTLVLSGCSGKKNEAKPSEASASASTSAPPSSSTASFESAPGADGEPVKDGTLIVALSADVTVLDPSREGGWETFLVNRNIHESLVKEDLSKTAQESPVVEIQPSLAESWGISPDGRVYTFHLRKGVKFQDGTNFNAQAVEFNVRRAWDKSFEFYDEISATNMLRFYQDLKEIKSIDESTVEFTFNHPFPAFLRLIAQGSGGSGLIGSPEAIKKYGNDGYAEHPVGTGPFQFVERVVGDKVVLKRFDGYWGDKAYASNLIFRPITDDNARLTALRTGEVDIIQKPLKDSIDQLKQDGFGVPEADIPSVYYLTLNTKNKYFQDAKVRQAFTLAIDREALAANLLKGYAIPAYSAAHAGNEAYDPNHKPYGYDVEKAKQLLAEAGYPDGFETTLQTWTGNEPYAEWIQRDLAKVGIQLKIETFDWATFGKQRFMTDAIGVNTMSWGFVTSYWLYVIGHSQSTGRYGNYSNPAYDEAVDKAMNEADPAKSLEYYKQARDVIDNDAAIVPLFSDKTLVAVGKNVKGFVLPSQNWYDLTKVWVGK
ncbi:ABC transporter substrate-binding protein [Cohnella massiliensis]|uniref:ABC transporter substrate-binding protein n=1 Tax=Cohnella massiliensis TaxID=1816691 RepID=UPI0009B9DC5C|nr:ABC transporter substrate-binding protein [Cohnella massiliensis]